MNYSRIRCWIKEWAGGFMNIKFVAICVLTCLATVAHADTADTELMSRCAYRYSTFGEQSALVGQRWEYDSFYGRVHCNYLCYRDLYYVRQCHQSDGGALDGGNRGRR